MYIFREKLYPKQEEDKRLSIELVSMFLNNIRLQKDSIKIFVVLDGTYELITNGGSYKLCKNDIFISAKHKFEMLSTTEKKNLMMVIDLSYDFIVEYGLKLDSQVLKYGDYDISSLRKIYNILFLEYNDALDSDYVKNKLYIELATALNKVIVDGEHNSICEDDDFENTWVYEMVMSIAKDIIEYPEKEHKLIYKAKEYSTSVSMISKSFSYVLGINYSAYVHIIRLSKSLDLLLESDKDILSIVFETGYNNPKSFHACFKKYMKTTPYVYRRKIRKNFESCYGYTSIYSVFSGEILNEIESYNFALSESFNEKSMIELSTSDMKRTMILKNDLFDKYIISIDKAQEFTDVFFDKVTSKLNVKNIRIEVLIEEGGKLYIKKNYIWQIIRLSDMASYVSAVIKTDIIPIINFSASDYFYNSDIDLIEQLLRIFEVLRDVIGAMRLREWIIEFTISDCYSLDNKKANYLMNFMSSFEKYLIGKFGFKNVGVHLGEINNINSDNFREQVLQVVSCDENIKYIAFKITQMDSVNYLEGNIFDIHKLLEAAKLQLDTYFDNKFRKKIYFSVIDIDFNVKYLSKYYIETFNNYNMATKLFWLIENSIPVVKIDCKGGKDRKVVELGIKESDELDTEELSEALFDYQLNYNCDFDNPRYFFYNFISNMYDEIYAYEGKVMLSRNESDIKCLFRLEFKDNCELLSKAEELENINKLCKKVLIEFPVDKGIYKLRIYTINSKNGNIINEISKMGKIENLGNYEINNLIKRTIPLLNVERVDLDNKFSRLFYLEPFEIKYIELFKID